MEFHEVVYIFPDMEPDEYTKLVEDIRQNGLREPIWTYQDKIIDGRHRYNACTDTKTPPRYQVWNGNGSLTMFVVSLNLHRRHMNSGQKAMVSLNIESQLAVEAKARQGTRNDIVEIIPQCDTGRASEQAAKIVGTNAHYVTDAKKIVATAPELQPLVMNNTISLPEAKQLATFDAPYRAAVVQQIVTGENKNVKSAEMTLQVRSGVPRALQSSGSNEWYTPEIYVEAARKLMGYINVDPASNEFANTKVIHADTFYDILTNGLDKNWMGTVWLNPPYGRTDEGSNQYVWTTKLLQQFECGNTTEAVLLVNAVTDRKWFQPLWRFPICFTDHRIRFYNQIIDCGQPTHGNALVYLGCQEQKFITLFQQFGPIVKKVS